MAGSQRGRQAASRDTWEVSSGNLIAAVQSAAAAGTHLVIDLSRLECMSSWGLRGLTVARREAGKATAITLAAPNDRMREIFAISRRWISVTRPRPNAWPCSTTN